MDWSTIHPNKIWVNMDLDKNGFNPLYSLEGKKKKLN